MVGIVDEAVVKDVASSGFASGLVRNFPECHTAILMEQS